MPGKKLVSNYTSAFSSNPGCSILQNSSHMAAYPPSHKSSKLGKQDILGIVEVKTDLGTIFYYELLHMNTPVFHQLCVDTGCCLEDLPRAVIDRYRLQERLKGIWANSCFDHEWIILSVNDISLFKCQHALFF